VTERHLAAGRHASLAVQLLQQRRLVVRAAVVQEGRQRRRRLSRSRGRRLTGGVRRGQGDLQQTARGCNVSGAGSTETLNLNTAESTM